MEKVRPGGDGLERPLVIRRSPGIITALFPYWRPLICSGVRTRTVIVDTKGNFMKATGVVLALIAVLAAAGCATTKEPAAVSGEYLVERDGLWYEAASEEPFSGVMVEYWPGGEKKVEAELIDGRVHGRLTEWDEDGQLASQVEYRDGELHGEAVAWYENGQKLAEVEFIDGEEVSRREWDEEGNPIE